MSLSDPRQMFMDPVVPFSGTILGGLSPGDMLLIQGIIPSDVDRFQVDLTCGSSVKPRADVAFHFNPRVKKGCVVCNSLQDERWGREEIHKVMPLRPGTGFEVMVLVQSQVYKVAVNGAHLLDYRHRVDLQRVDTLLIQGKVQVRAIAVLPPNQSPFSSSDFKPRASLGPDSSQALSSSRDLNVPYKAEIFKGLSPGHSITVKGRTLPQAQSLSLDLCVGGSSSIALRLNPRLKQRVFVRNSLLFDCWGPEETETETEDFPFGPDQYFEMIVLCEVSQYRVAVNGKHQFDYKHRVQDLSRVTLLELSGDLRLEEVRLL